MDPGLSHTFRSEYLTYINSKVNKAKQTFMSILKVMMLVLFQQCTASRVQP